MSDIDELLKHLREAKENACRGLRGAQRRASECRDGAANAKRFYSEEIHQYAGWIAAVEELRMQKDLGDKVTSTMATTILKRGIGHVEDTKNGDPTNT